MHGGSEREGVKTARWSPAMVTRGTELSKEGKYNLSVFVSGFRHSQEESRHLGLIIKNNSKTTYYLRARK
jgi:hypothetical protein